jgi:hypothetical protein
MLVAIGHHFRGHTMPRYYFDLYDNSILLADDQGTELDSAQEAHRQAIIALAEIAKDLLPENGQRTLIMQVKTADHCAVARARIDFDPGTLFSTAKTEAIQGALQHRL